MYIAIIFYQCLAIYIFEWYNIKNNMWHYKEFYDACIGERNYIMSKCVWDCPACGSKEITSKFCPDCGAKKPEVYVTWDCSACGYKRITSKFCPECGVKKPLHNDEPTSNTANGNATADNTVGVGNVNNYLNRGFIFLEDGKWESANDYFEKALDIDCRCAEAYLGKLMCDLNLKHRNELGNCLTTFDDNKHFEKIMRFGDEDLKTEMHQYISTITTRNDENAYQRALDKMHNASTSEEYHMVALQFGKLGNYKDSVEMEAQCRELCEGSEKDEKYSVAIEKYNTDDSAAVKEALAIFGSLVDWKDSKEYIEKCHKKIEVLKSREKRQRLVNEKVEKEVKKAKKIKTAIAVLSSIVAVLAVVVLLVVYNHTTKLQNLRIAARQNVIAAGGHYTVAITEDGSVLSTDFDYYEYGIGSSASTGVDYDEYGMNVYINDCIAKNPTLWTDMVDVSAGNYYVLGVRSDGSVVYNDYILEGWTDFVDVSIGSIIHFTGLNADGTVKVGSIDKEMLKYVGDVSEWSDIMAVSAGDMYTLGLKSDGSIVWDCVDMPDDGVPVGKWTDIVAISSSDNFVVGLKSDGTVVSTGPWENRRGIGDWTDIVAISAGANHIIGLKSDGTVVAVGDNSYGQCDVAQWKDIVAISAGYRHTVGVKSDGTAVAVGDNSYGQCDVEHWTNIKMPELLNMNVLDIKEDKVSSSSNTSRTTNSTTTPAEIIEEDLNYCGKWESEDVGNLTLNIIEATDSLMRFELNTTSEIVQLELGTITATLNDGKGTFKIDGDLLFSQPDSFTMLYGSNSNADRRITGTGTIVLTDRKIKLSMVLDNIDDSGIITGTSFVKEGTNEYDFSQYCGEWHYINDTASETILITSDSGKPNISGYGMWRDKILELQAFNINVHDNGISFDYCDSSQGAFGTGMITSGYDSISIKFNTLEEPTGYSMFDCTLSKEIVNPRDLPIESSEGIIALAHYPISFIGKTFNDLTNCYGPLYSWGTQYDNLIEDDNNDISFAANDGYTSNHDALISGIHIGKDQMIANDMRVGATYSELKSEFGDMLSDIYFHEYFSVYAASLDIMLNGMYPHIVILFASDNANAKSIECEVSLYGWYSWSENTYQETTVSFSQDCPVYYIGSTYDEVVDWFGMDFSLQSGNSYQLYYPDGNSYSIWNSSNYNGKNLTTGTVSSVEIYSGGKLTENTNIGMSYSELNNALNYWLSDIYYLDMYSSYCASVDMVYKESYSLNIIILFDGNTEYANSTICYVFCKELI